MVFARFTVFGDFRGRVLRRGKVNVAPATAAPLGNNQFLALFNQVADNLTGVKIADRGPLGSFAYSSRFGRSWP